ncbi:hypothetical protein [Treponema brennaborense]|uniref:Uncharacterized protein n=1 Tax=Treponema brennaborense (strain DSM 12168 / CIP 105900 / DD5/3) TaxID=906968 RepID=F4LP52_TREBD|nr:hypothetical protein [Treponema brennaborense]AEE15928.1 hypothetical protein Trebr_0484 [Treponema brennaborense DSM 12168]
MDESISQSKSPPQRYEPGELDKTRKNIGNIDPGEAQKIAKLLGGEIGIEKSAPIDEAALKKVRSAMKTSELRSGVVSSKRPRDPASQPVAERTAAQTASAASAVKNNRDMLPDIPAKERGKIEKLMMAPEYRIKPNYGIFNIFASLTKNGQEKIAAPFVTITLKTYILRMQNFSNKIKELVRTAPESYRKKLETDEDLKFRFLKTAGSWSLQNVQTLYADLERKPTEITVTMMIPLIKQIYKPLLSLFFLGESKTTELIKSVYTDIAVYPDAKKERAFEIAKEAVSEWLYVYNRVIKGLYPLLMRMCSPDFQAFPDFFILHTAKIFSFLNITKFDVLVPEKKAKKENAGTSPAVPEKSAEQLEEERRKKEAEQKQLELVQTGLKLLDRIFPGAGWLHLDEAPDLYPFYQPLYTFVEGLNFIPPENPMQVVIILIKIIEDFMEGCRNITFAAISDKKDLAGNSQNDSFGKIMNEWTTYRETLFEKLYVSNLKDLVNHLYTQKDFTRSQYGKKLMSNILWHTRYNFLPYLQFEQLLLEKPVNEAKVRPLYIRTPLLVNELFRFTLIADDTAKSGKESLEIPNIHAPYRYDIPNVVSRRLDVLLGAKKKQGGRATNANLLKYMLAIAAVLDWWINNKSSPAYAGSDNQLYRTSPEDGSPVFSVPERSDQNELFVHSIKAAAAPGVQPAAET